MYSFNKVILIGNLVREPEVRFTNEGVPVTTFSIAINQYRKDRENQEPTFIKIVTWRKLAENCGQYLHKGSTILAEGRLKSRRFTSRDGVKVTTIEVIAYNVQFLRLKDKEETPGAEGEPSDDYGGHDMPEEEPGSEIQETEEPADSDDENVPF